MSKMKENKKILVTRICLGILLVAATIMVGCAAKNEQPEVVTQDENVEQEKEPIEASDEVSEDVSIDNQGFFSLAVSGSRNFLIGENANLDMPEYVPSVPKYQVESDFSNIENMDRIHLQEHMLDQLAKNYFVVVDGEGYEFFDEYEYNRYMQTPNFVTVDSMMHTYHLYFAMLQKNTERNYLLDAVKNMSKDMQESSMSQYEQLKGSEWEEASKINVAFFTVGATLIGADVSTPNYVKDIAERELELISAAEAIEKSPLIDELEDYSQYKPRGYYDGDEQLEKYFRTMMWYGRRNFTQKDELTDRCALLMTLALSDESFENWEKVYSITAFFAGASDDSGIYEYYPLIQQAYGENVTSVSLIGNEEAFQKYHRLTAELDPPAINSMVFMDDGGKTDKTEEAKGYRFMGQRFTLDAAIFTQLCYSKVKENPDGNTRNLPDSLDVPAAMGSDVALDLLEEDGNFEYQGYTENMNKVREEIANASSLLWRASLYGGWLDTLRPLLTEKGEGYPVFMQNSEWTKKNVESFLSSFTELKHDTVLYSKQFMAEMGGDNEVLDDRGYVEPEVEVYAKLSALTKNTAEGLESFGVLSKADKENLERLSELSDRLKEISVKELTGDKITEEDYELIRSYGGNIEHFWAEAVKEQDDDGVLGSVEYPAALVVDVATDPNGAVLEQAIGGISTIYVVVPVEGKLRIAKGAVFTYYQFMQPIGNRLTDVEWRQMLGMGMDENMVPYEKDESIKQPEWTQSYRSQWEYDY
ncbi:MAG TPA: DUF3160 domain-containing protein [Lachnospiraceae bacterium]|nr:DUF3160 domain-containing protein [Lachnospiraceae bacterium]